EYVRGVGRSSVHLTAHFWRLHAVDFRERSLLGPSSGTTLADSPIDSAELAPYYTRVHWEIGVCGTQGPSDRPRSKTFPMPPMPVTSSGVLMEKGAKKLALHAQPAPLAIRSQPFNNRPSCINCGYCMGYGCEVGAKASTLAAMIPLAQQTGRCEIRAECAVFRLETGANGKISEV